MKILFIGDVVGRPGRAAVARVVPELRRSRGVDFVVANAENAAGGRGVTPQILEELIAAGVDAVTLGNHAWDRKEIAQIIDDPRVLRPANYPPEVPGRGFNTYPCGDGRVSVLCLMGRVYLPQLDCPFRGADAALEKIGGGHPILVDIHAEITSEKQAMGWHLDGRVTAVIGTHTHVQTADERILPGGTAFITDVGMSGPLDSVIGMAKEDALKRFLSGIPVRLEVAEGRAVLGAALVDSDGKGRAAAIERIHRIL